RSNPCSNARWNRTRGFRERLSPGVGGFNRYSASVGTSVLERRYEAIMAKTTASARGTNKYFGTPVRKNIGRNTMQMLSVDTKAGTAICDAPSRIAVPALVSTLSI